LARVKDLEAWMDLGLKGDEFIEADENEPLKQRVGALFLRQDKVLIDGKQLRPILDRTAFVKYAMTGSTFLVQPERLPINTAMVGVIITYLTKEIPKEVTSEWNLWSDRIKKIPTSAIDPAGPFPGFVTPDDNILTWKNFLKTYSPPTIAKIALHEALTTIKMPIASLLCFAALLPIGWLMVRQRKQKKPVLPFMGLAIMFIAGGILLYPFLKVDVAKPVAIAPKITDEEAVAILNSLLKNIYRSFDFREESDVYDRLAASVSGNLLSEIYLQNRKSLVVTQAGGARARVKEIDILKVHVDHLDGRPLGLLFRARWTAVGSVGHWGHIHIRKNQYDANITVEPVEGAWKITDLELLEETRIDQNIKPKQ
jgi:hypothetical protein